MTDSPREKNGVDIKTAQSKCENNAGEIYGSLFLDSYSIMLIIRPDNGDILDANKSACRFYGLTKSQLTQMKIMDINTLSEREVLGEMAQAKSEKRNFFNFRHRLANGEIRDVEVYSGPIRYRGEQVLYSIIHDVTEKKRLEKQVILEKRFSESLINSLPGVMYLFHKDGKMVKWNRNLEMISGFSSEEIRSMHAIDFISPEHRKLIRDHISYTLMYGSTQVEALYLTKLGKKVPYIFSGVKIQIHGTDYIVGVGMDISERKKNEELREKLIAELQEALSQVKKLSGLLPICAACKKIRDDKGYWKEVECYIQDYSDATFSHGICPECTKELYPELSKKKSKREK